MNDAYEKGLAALPGIEARVKEYGMCGCDKCREDAAEDISTLASALREAAEQLAERDARIAELEQRLLDVEALAVSSVLSASPEDDAELFKRIAERSGTGRQDG